MADSRRRYNASDWNVAGLAIADPGDGEAIPVSAATIADGTVGRGYCALTTAGAETRTIAAPTVVGQELLVWLDTDGGDGVVTVAHAINQAGNNTITMADAGDYFTLRAYTLGGALKWKIVENDGAALSTV